MAHDLKESLPGEYERLDLLMIDAAVMLLDIADVAEPIAAQRVSVPHGWVILPRELTAENGAKHALIGEIPCHIDGIRVAVPWTSIKEVHKAVVRLFEGKAPISSAGTPLPL